jgi:hypothetical protein
LPGDVAGFIDSLTSLAAHLREREAFEADVRRGWARMSVFSALFVPLGLLAGWLSGGITAVGSRPYYGTWNALMACALLTAALAAVLFLQVASKPWRCAPDSVDRVALRHEDSPLRDRIRITQWILFDSVFTRFGSNESRVNVVIAYGVLGVSIFATFALSLMPALAYLLSGSSLDSVQTGPAVLGLFLVLVLVTILTVSRRAKAALRLAQHYGHQVLAFDDDFGGFLPRTDREHVERVVNMGGGKAKADPDA